MGRPLSKLDQRHASDSAPSSPSSEITLSTVIWRRGIVDHGEIGGLAARSVPERILPCPRRLPKNSSDLFITLFRGRKCPSAQPYQHGISRRRASIVISFMPSRVAISLIRPQPSTAGTRVSTCGVAQVSFTEHLTSVPARMHRFHPLIQHRSHLKGSEIRVHRPMHHRCDFRQSERHRGRATNAASTPSLCPRARKIFHAHFSCALRRLQ